MRVELYDVFGDRLWDDFDAIRADLTRYLDERDQTDDEEPQRAKLTDKIKRQLLDPKTWARDAMLCEAATLLRRELGEEIWDDFNEFCARADAVLSRHKDRFKLSAAEKKLLLRWVAWRDEAGAPVIAKIHKAGKKTSDPLHGVFGADFDFSAPRNSDAPGNADAPQLPTSSF